MNIDRTDVQGDPPALSPLAPAAAADPRSTSHLALAALVARLGLGLLLLKAGFMEISSGAVQSQSNSLTVLKLFLDSNLDLPLKIVAFASILSGVALIFGILTKHAAVAAAVCLTSSSWRALLSLFMPGAIVTPMGMGRALPGLLGEDFFESRSTLGLMLAVVVLLLSPSAINRWTLDSLVFAKSRASVARIRAGRGPVATTSEAH